MRPQGLICGILQARILDWVAIPFSRDLPNSGIEPRSTTLQADSLPPQPQLDIILVFVPLYIEHFFFLWLFQAFFFFFYKPLILFSLKMICLNVGGFFLFSFFLHLSHLMFSEFAGSMICYLALICRNSQSLFFQISLLFFSLFVLFVLP